MSVGSIAEIRARLRVNEVKQFHVKPEELEPERPCPKGWSSEDLKTLKRLRIVDGLPTDEIGRLMGRSGRAVRSKLSRKGWVAPYKKRGLACR